MIRSDERRLLPVTQRLRSQALERVYDGKARLLLDDGLAFRDVDFADDFWRLVSGLPKPLHLVVRGWNDTDRSPLLREHEWPEPRICRGPEDAVELRARPAFAQPEHRTPLWCCEGLHSRCKLTPRRNLLVLGDFDEL